MHRIVFFGMNGGFSTVTLHALATRGLMPKLVIRGLTRTPATKNRPTIEVSRARPPLFERLKTRLWGAPAEDVVRVDEDRALAPIAEPPTVRMEDFIEGDLEAAAKRFGIDAITTTDANALRVRVEVAGVEPDLFVVAGFPHLLSRDLLPLARRGGLNLHPGKLPSERGPSPLFWALKEGRTKISFTIHVLDEGEDSGDVVSSGEVEFEPGLDGELILTRTAQAAAPQVVRAIRSILDGDLVRMPQRREGWGRCPRPGFRDGRIDPAKTAREVFTFVGGCARTHSVFVECGGDRFFIREAVSFDDAAKLPFEYVLTGDRLVLRCSTGVVELMLKEEGALFSAEYEGE